jgi:hypothetical protein
MLRNVEESGGRRALFSFCLKQAAKPALFRPAGAGLAPVNRCYLQWQPGGGVAVISRILR